MVNIFQNNIGDYHIWKKSSRCKNVVNKGLHNSLTTCDGKESDLYVQMQKDSFEEEVISKLSKSQRDDLENGYMINTKKFDFEDLEGFGN